MLPFSALADASLKLVSQAVSCADIAGHEVKIIANNTNTSRFIGFSLYSVGIVVSFLLSS